MANRVRSKRMGWKGWEEVSWSRALRTILRLLFQIRLWHLLVKDILKRNRLAWKIVVPELPTDSSMTGESFLAGGIFGCDASRPDKDLIGIAVQHLLRSDLPQFVIVVLLHWLLRGLGSRLRCNHWIDPATRMLSAQTYPSDPEQNLVSDQVLKRISRSVTCWWVGCWTGWEADGDAITGNKSALVLKTIIWSAGYPTAIGHWEVDWEMQSLDRSGYKGAEVDIRELPPQSGLEEPRNTFQ